jgi:Zinc knuckle
MWGQFVPTKLAASDADDDKKKARDKLLAMFFLAGADKKRFGKLVEDLNNAYLSGKDNYPESIESTLTLLTHYQDHKSGGQNAGENDNQLAANFAQGNRRIRCFECNQFGHYRRECPRRQQVQAQQQQEEGPDERRLTREELSGGWHQG